MARALCLCALVLLAAGLQVHAQTCPELVSVGTATITGTWTFNLETGVLGGGTGGADLWWNQQTSTTRFLVPLNGAQLAAMPAGTYFWGASPTDVKAQPLSSASIDGSDGMSQLTPGTVLAFKTRSGNFGKLLVQSINPAKNNGLVITWMTYKTCSCAGQASSQATIKGTWTLSLDTGVQGVTADSDVWWDQQTTTTRALVPLNGALLALMPAGTDFASLSLATVQTLALSTNSIDGSDSRNLLTPGTVVAFKSRTGRYGKLLVQGYDLAQNHGLMIQWQEFSDTCICVC